MIKEAIEVFYQYVDAHKEMVLSTAANNYVTSRMMSTFRIDNRIYFQCGIHSRKMKQMTINPQVALCAGAYCITGHAKVIAPTKEILDGPLMQKYKSLYENAYNLYASGDNNLIEVTMEHVNQWFYMNGLPYERFIDFTSGTTQLVKYDLTSM